MNPEDHAGGPAHRDEPTIAGPTEPAGHLPAEDQPGPATDPGEDYAFSRELSQPYAVLVFAGGLLGVVVANALLWRQALGT